jgi:hypothetical protein
LAPLQQNLSSLDPIRSLPHGHAVVQPLIVASLEMRRPAADGKQCARGVERANSSSSVQGILVIEIHKGQAPAQLSRPEFSVRFHASFADPAFRSEGGAVARLEEIAWQAYSEGRPLAWTCDPPNKEDHLP